MADDTQRQTYPGKGKMGPDGNKEKSSKAGGGKNGFGVDAGTKNHMIQGTSAAPQVPGQSASQKSGGGKFPVGGKGHMFGPQSAGPQVAGEAGHDTSGDGGKFASGGKGHMFGPQCADPAKPA